MKILKPGKVDQRKFVCPACECEFEAGGADKSYSLGYYVLCPCCNNKLWWSDGEPYEEPVQDSKERLADLIYESCVTDAETAWEIADHLIANGVTFMEG